MRYQGRERGYSIGDPGAMPAIVIEKNASLEQLSLAMTAILLSCLVHSMMLSLIINRDESTDQAYNIEPITPAARPRSEP